MAEERSQALFEAAARMCRRHSGDYLAFVAALEQHVAAEVLDILRAAPPGSAELLTHTHGYYQRAAALVALLRKAGK